MSPWQKRARIGVAIFGLAVAAIVFFAMRERETPVPPAPVERIDPKSVAEFSGCELDRYVFTTSNFTIDCESWRLYEDGSLKANDVTITVPKGENRTFRVSARDASAGKDESELGLTGDVRLEDSDGFVLTTEQGGFDQKDAIARAPGAVTFGRGRMSGSGSDVSYDQAHDLLVIGSQAQIRTTDDAGNPFLDFSAGRAALDRVRHVLTLETSVRIMRGGQIIEADHVEARLSENDDIVTFIALRGNARVEGGGSSIDAMSARNINLDYTDDGTRLEVVELNGDAAVAMTGEKGGGDREIVAELIGLTLAEDGSSRMVLTNKASVVTAGAGGGRGRTIAGDMLEIDMAADGSLTRAVGRENVRLDLPSAAGAPVRSISTQRLDGRGTAGKGLTSATFTGDVRYTEGAGKTTAARTARAQTLEAVMAGDAVNMAVFTGDVTFEETGLKACAGRLEYQPEKGTLKLSVVTPAGLLPTLAEEQVNIEAQAIDVALQGQSRQFVARGGVTTRMGSGTRCRPSTERAPGQRGATRLPGLLDAKAAVTIRAATLDYQGSTGTAIYTGVPGSQASISQGRTAIYGDSITIDQTTGDLTAAGGALSTMTLDGELSTGRAYQIRYVDAKRVITFAAPPAGYVAPPAVPGMTAVLLPELSGSHGNINAGSRIEVELATEGGTAAGIKAFSNVTFSQGTGANGRSASGASTLTYEPDEQQYVMSATGTMLVKYVERTATSCREFSGRTLTFSGADDTIDVDGKQMNRASAGACAPSAR